MAENVTIWWRHHDIRVVGFVSSPNHHVILLYVLGTTSDLIVWHFRNCGNFFPFTYICFYHVPFSDLFFSITREVCRFCESFVVLTWPLIIYLVVSSLRVCNLWSMSTMKIFICSLRYKISWVININYCNNVFFSYELMRLTIYYHGLSWPIMNLLWSW